MFRKLTASEIDVRVSTIKENGVSLLLYKDARCDMNILDETVGQFNWMRSHTRDNANCIVSIWDKNKNQWISKEDTGTESYTEKEKGIASDSFKRACFNWGIGRELYTAPFIWVSDVEVKEYKGKLTTKDRFSVKTIGCDAKGNINELEIINSRGKTVYTFGVKPKEVSTITLDMVKDLASKKGVTDAQILARINNNTPEKEHVKEIEKLTQPQLVGIYKLLGKTK